MWFAAVIVCFQSTCVTGFDPKPFSGFHDCRREVRLAAPKLGLGAGADGFILAPEKFLAQRKDRSPSFQNIGCVFLEEEADSFKVIVTRLGPKSGAEL